jgi:adenylate kinase family enzyme
VDRIAIVGPVASGKTTLARRLAPLLGLPVVDLDHFYWRAIPRPTEEEWIHTHQELIGGDHWIMAGDYRAVAEARFRAAEAVIWLDLPRHTCLARVTRRKTKGNPSPLVECWRWIWRYPTHGRRETAAVLADPTLTCAVLHLRTSSEVASFLRALER